MLDFVLRSRKKALGELGIKWESKTLLDFDHDEGLGVQEENIRKRNGFLKVLRVQGARISLKVNAEKAESLLLGVSENEEVMLG